MTTQIKPTTAAELRRRAARPETVADLRAVTVLGEIAMRGQNLRARTHAIELLSRRRRLHRIFEGEGRDRMTDKAEQANGDGTQPPVKRTLNDQIKCLRRELALRLRCYPKWVEGGRMKQEAAELELSSMQAAHDSLMKYKAVLDSLRALGADRIAQLRASDGDAAAKLVEIIAIVQGKQQPADGTKPADS
jgi:hypothetical protein